MVATSNNGIAPMAIDKPDHDASIPSIMYAKGKRAWTKTIYVLGLPRSGKSTVYNVLASCAHVEALEEPLELLAVAHKASTHSPDSNEYVQYHDLYTAFMENSFSELVLGRVYNFRKQDKSCIFNYKSAKQIESAFALSRRMDVLQYAKQVEATFLIAFNDMERSIEFIASAAPGVQFVQLQRDVFDVANEIAEKEWLTDDQLSMQANLMPAYSAVVEHKGQTIYVPYTIRPQYVDLFLSLENFERSLMYAIIQDRDLTRALSVTAHPYHEIRFEDIITDPSTCLQKLIAEIGVADGELTAENIKRIKKLNIAPRLDNLHRPHISKRLKNFMAEIPESI